MHAPKQQVLLGAHPKVFLATNPQGALRHSDCCADFRDIEGPFWTVFEQDIEAPHDRVMILVYLIRLMRICLSEAANDCFEK